MFRKLWVLYKWKELLIIAYVDLIVALIQLSLVPGHFIHILLFFTSFYAAFSLVWKMPLLY